MRGNSNASFLATDGAASLGLVGVLLVSVLLSMILFVINMLTRRWPPALVIPTMAPMALILTNGSLFTVLISFGMLPWIAIFFVYRLKKFNH
ncbi:MAG: hypothetical protein CSA60_02505 [Neptuniibacter caesariensis]|uniref:Uncharacterized protein n=1 Tax=Neptuniibacter caesariensis TaxID=207954 RepID=A0A2G6JN53_NEPCE|nr:MAG: hypothetical protein CSA60_02505 [Neptuniibacter caesariensis]